MKFSVQAKALQEAIDTVTLVTPLAITVKNESGYLFSVRENTCSLSSRDGKTSVRVDIPAVDVEGSGSFIYPSTKLGALKFLEGSVDFEAGLDGDRHWVKYSSDCGAKAERSTFDPELMQSLDEDLSRSSEGFSVQAALLREGLSQVRSYVVKPNDTRQEEHLKTVQLFDAEAKKEWSKGDGCMYATDGIRMVHFMCDAFKGKGLSVHGSHIPGLLAFLAKCEGSVQVRPGGSSTYVVDSKNRVFGWAQHLRQHGKYAYYPLKMDKFVFRIQKANLVRAVKLVRAELDANKDKIRVDYSYRDAALKFRSSDVSGQSESIPVAVEVVSNEAEEYGMSGGNSDFSCNLNVDQFIELIEPSKGTHVELHAAVLVRDDKEHVLFRTIEEYPVNSAGKVLVGKESKGADEEVFQCKVTRFMPSKD